MTFEIGSTWSESTEDITYAVTIFGKWAGKYLVYYDDESEDIWCESDFGHYLLVE